MQKSLVKVSEKKNIHKRGNIHSLVSKTLGEGVKHFALQSRSNKRRKSRKVATPKTQHDCHALISPLKKRAYMVALCMIPM